MDIQRFKEEMHMSKPGDFLESHVFQVGDEPFTLLVYPNGSEEQYEGHVSVEVAHNGEGDVYVESLKITTMVKEGMEPAQETVCSIPITKDENAYCWTEWLTHAECLASMKNNIFEIKAYVQLLGERVVIGQDADDVTGDKSRYISDFKSLLKDTSLADFVIRCGGKAFKCHKVILSARSPVFRGMIASEMEETRRGEATIEDVEAETVKKVLEFIYSDAVEELGTQGQVEQLLYAADKYEIQDLVRIT
jgi:hypothetical protein